VLGVDIDIRAHNREAIEAHPMASRIQMLQGSSIDPEIIEQVRTVAADYKRVLICLDSNHTHEHALAELEAYAPLTTVGSYEMYMISKSTLSTAGLGRSYLRQLTAHSAYVGVSMRIACGLRVQRLRI